MVTELYREKAGEGSLQERNDEYKIVICYKIVYQDEETEELSRKYPQKSFATGLSTKGSNLRNAKKMQKAVFERFDPYNPDIPIKTLLSTVESHEEKNEDISINESEVEVKTTLLNNNMAVEDDILLADYMEKWLEEYKVNIEETTFASYKLYVDKKIVPYFREKGMYLNQLTSQDVHNFYKDMRKSGGSTVNRNSLKNKNTSLSAESVRRIHSVLRKALVCATDDGILSTNVVSKIKRPDKPVVEEFQPSFYSVDEANELLRVCKGNILEVPVKLALFYGLRRSEVLGLRWSALNFDGDGLLTVNNAYVQCKVDDKYVDFPKPRAKSKSSMRSFDLDEDMRTLLLGHKSDIEKWRKKYKKAYNAKNLDYVCVNEMGNVIKPNYVTKNFKRLLEENNLRPIRFHDLRHTCSAFLLSKGLSLMVVKNHLGHSTYNTTEKFYGHLDTSAKKQSVQAMKDTGLDI